MGHARRFCRPRRGETPGMSDKAAITINLPREEVQQRWTSSAPEIDGDVTFKDAPGDRGTEIHVTLGSSGGPIDKIRGAVPLAKAKDQLRHFKQQVETGRSPAPRAPPKASRWAPSSSS